VWFCPEKAWDLPAVKSHHFGEQGNDKKGRLRPARQDAGKR
jgi:hypothetical protein